MFNWLCSLQIHEATMTKKSFKKYQKDLKLRHYFLIKLGAYPLTPVSTALRKSVRFFSKWYNSLPYSYWKCLYKAIKKFSGSVSSTSLYDGTNSYNKCESCHEKNNNLKTDGFKTIVSLFFHGKNLPVARFLNKWDIGKTDRDVMHPRFHYNEMAIFFQTTNIFAPRGSAELQSKLLPLHEAPAVELGKKYNFLWSLDVIDKTKTLNCSIWRQNSETLPLSNDPKYFSED